MDRARRNFIISIFAGYAALSSPTAISAPNKVASKNGLPEYLTEAIEAAWYKTQLLTPEEYLSTSRVQHQSLAEISAHEFRNDRVLHVDGLILSLTESAFILA
jgi:hypothetical protein